jgi:hypothetical protein
MDQVVGQFGHQKRFRCDTLRLVGRSLRFCFVFHVLPQSTPKTSQSKLTSMDHEFPERNNLKAEETTCFDASAGRKVPQIFTALIINCGFCG